MRSIQTRRLYSASGVSFANARKTIDTVLWYAILCAVAVVTVFPFVWVFFMTVLLLNVFRMAGGFRRRGRPKIQ